MTANVYLTTSEACTQSHEEEYLQSGGADLKAPARQPHCAESIPCCWTVRMSRELGGRIHSRNGREKAFRGVAIYQSVRKYFNILITRMAILIHTCWIQLTMLISILANHLFMKILGRNFFQNDGRLYSSSASGF